MSLRVMGGGLAAGTGTFDTVPGGSFTGSFAWNLLGRLSVTLGGVLTANTTITVTGLTAGCEFDLLLIQDSTGGRTCTLTVGASSLQLQIATAANASSLVRCQSVNGTDVDVTYADALDGVMSIQPRDPIAGEETYALFINSVTGATFNYGLSQPEIQTRSGDPLVPTVPTYPVVSSSSFTLVAVMAGYFVRATPGGGGATVRIPGATQPLSAGFSTKIGNEGPGTLAITADSDVTVFPAGSLTMGPGKTVTFNVVDENVVWVEDADVAITGAPVNTAAPQITGDNHVGSTLSISSYGSWTPPGAVLSAIQWQFDAGGGSFTNLSSGTGATYLIVVGDIGRAISARVTYTSAGQTTAARSNAITAIAAAGSAPGNTAVPTLDQASYQVAQQAIATAGTWNNTPSSYVYAFQTSPTGANTWTTLLTSPSTTSTTYQWTIAASAAGKDFRVAVTATNATGSATANSTTKTVASSASNMVTLVTNDMKNYIVGAHGTPLSPDDAEHRPMYSGDWSYRSKLASANVFTSYLTTARPLAMPWLVLDQRSSGQPSTATVRIRDYQMWAKISGTWSRVSYSVGSQGFALWNLTWTGTSGATQQHSGGGGSPDVIHLGPNPPSGSRTPAGYMFHAWAPAWVSTSADRAGITQALVAFRAQLTSSDATATYEMAAGCDFKDTSYGSVVGAVQCHFKDIPTDGTWRVYSGLMGAATGDGTGLSLTGPFPDLTGVASNSELY